MGKIRLLLISAITLAAALSTGAQTSSLTVNTSAGGELREKIIGSGFDNIDRLEIKGILNADDWQYLTSGKGLIATVKDLDISDVGLVLDGEVYRSIYIDSGSMGVGTTLEYRFWHTDSISTGSTLQGGITTYWGNNLAGAFQNTEFQSVKLPEFLEALGSYAFSGATKLTDVDFSGKETSIGDRAFTDCRSLTSISLPASVVSIGADAFYGTSLVKIDLGNVTSLQYGMFARSSTLKSVVLSDNLENIPDECFSSCTELESINMPSKLKSIGNNAFGGCPSLQLKSLPRGLVSIGEYAFTSCSKIDNLEIPESVYNIGSGAFYNTPFFDNLAAENGVIYVGKVAYALTDNDITKLSFKEGTLGIASMLCKWGHITEVKFPESLKSIGKETFCGCPLSEISFPASLEEIGCDAFAGSHITSLTLHENLKILGNGAFKDNDRLITIRYNPVNAVVPEEYSFPFYESSADRIIIGTGVKNIPNGLFARMQGCNVSSIELPEGLESIGNDAFSIYGLTDVNLPESLISIGDGAFSQTHLQEVTLGEKLEYVGNDAFAGIETLRRLEYNCIDAKSAHYTYETQFGPATLWGTPFGGSNANEVIIGNNVSRIPAHFFENAQFDCGIWLPDALKEIGDYAFYSSTITSLRFPSDLKIIPHAICRTCWNLNEIIFPENVEIIEDDAFGVCRQLYIPELPSSITKIGDYAFAEVNFPEHIILPPYLETIGKQAFRKKSSFVSSIFIPETVKEIGEMALVVDQSSSFLHGVVVKSMCTDIPLTEDGNPFDNDKDQYKRNMYWTLIAPSSSLDRYNSAKGWSDFETVIPNGSLTLSDDKVFTVCPAEGCDIDTYRKGIVIDGVYHSSEYVAGAPDYVAIDPMDETLMDDIVGKKIGNYDLYHEGYRGYIVKLPAGNGRVEITLTDFSSGDAKLKIGDNAAVTLENTGESQSIDYNLDEPVYAYLYNASDNISYVNRISVIPASVGLEDSATHDNVTVTGRYLIDGNPAGDNAHGIVIEKLSDGTARKVMR